MRVTRDERDAMKRMTRDVACYRMRLLRNDGAIGMDTVVPHANRTVDGHLSPYRGGYPGVSQGREVSQPEKTGKSICPDWESY